MDVCPSISPEMKARYLERRKADLVLLKTALTQRDFEAFARVGHTLKGNASSFGFEELGRIGETLEKAGLASEERGALVALLSFKNWLADHGVTSEG